MRYYTPALELKSNTNRPPDETVEDEPVEDEIRVRIYYERAGVHGVVSRVRVRAFVGLASVHKCGLSIFRVAPSSLSNIMGTLYSGTRFLFKGGGLGKGDSSARRRHQKGHRICVNSLLSTKYDDVGNVLCQGESKNERHPFLRKPVCFESSTKCSHKHLPNFMHFF